MNAEQIRQMKAGRELDALVAEKVMEWSMRHESPPMFVDDQQELIVVSPTWTPRAPHRRFMPSRDIAAAWEVLEKVTAPAPAIRGDGIPPNSIFMHLFQNGFVWAMDAKEAAESICKWALLAVMGDES